MTSPWLYSRREVESILELDLILSVLQLCACHHSGLQSDDDNDDDDKLHLVILFIWVLTCLAIQYFLYLC